MLVESFLNFLCKVWNIVFKYPCIKFCIQYYRFYFFLYKVLDLVYKILELQSCGLRCRNFENMLLQSFFQSARFELKFCIWKYNVRYMLVVCFRYRSRKFWYMSSKNFECCTKLKGFLYIISKILLAEQWFGFEFTMFIMCTCQQKVPKFDV